MVAGGTYDNEFFFENVLNKFGGLFTGRVITNDFTLDNKQMISITMGGIANNNKLTTQGYVDSKAQDLRDYVDNHYFSKPEINVKIDGINDVIDGLADNIESVADSVTALSATVALCATTAAMLAALATKADKSEVYDKGDIDDMIEDLEDTIRTKANASNVYTKNEVNNMVNGKANAADVYTKTEVNNIVSGKANTSDVYTKTEINGFLLLKANISDVYTKNEIDAALILKANVADVYTKTETNNLLTLKANTSDVYTKTEVDTALNLKADKATTYTKTEVDAMIGGVVPTADSVGKKYPSSIGGEIFNAYNSNEASGQYSHAEGVYTKATGDFSHAGGYNTEADQISQTAIGKYNTKNNAGCLFAVGNGTNDVNRKDAFCVYTDGELRINNNYRLYFGPIIFAFADNDASYPSNNTLIKEVSAIGFAYTYPYGGKTYLNVNVSNVPTGHTNTPTAFYLIYVRLEGSNECFGNTFNTLGYASGPIICYETATNPLIVSIESQSTYVYSSRLFKHWNVTQVNGSFAPQANFNFSNTNFVNCYYLN